MTTEVIDIRKKDDTSAWKIIFSDNPYEYIEYYKNNNTLCLNDSYLDRTTFGVEDIDNLIKALQKVKEIYERS